VYAATVSAHSFADIVGQSEAVEFLQGVAARGRYANAYLLYGPPGVGKGTAAIAFARALLCERVGGAFAPAATSAQAGLFGDAPAPAPSRQPAGEACGECAACTKTAELQHPDLKFLFPVSGEESKLDDTIIETLAEWRADPLFVFVYDKAASIRLSMTRELLREMAFKPFEAGRRVVVVRDADRMREDQFSAMLKSIEEPGSSTVWVITSSRPGRMPATIRSRCQRVRFRPLDEAVIASFLTDRVGLDRTMVALLAGLSSGSLGRALSLREANPEQAREHARGLLGRARSGNYAELWKEIQGLMAYGKVSRETLRRLIELQMLWLRDLLRARYGGETERFVHADRKADVLRAAQSIDATEIRRRLMILEEALRSIEGNVSPDLTLFSTQSRLADPSRSRTEWPEPPSAPWRY
jgi:DNA polymerase-3 subunit delta'